MYDIPEQEGRLHMLALYTSETAQAEAGIHAGRCALWTHCSCCLATPLLHIPFGCATHLATQQATTSHEQHQLDCATEVHGTAQSVCGI